MARKILLADDSVTAQNMGRRILTDAGYEVVTVNNGSAALKRIAESKPDLIVLDVYMPGYGGLEVCQRIRDSQETARIPVLLTVGKLEPFKPEEVRRVRERYEVTREAWERIRAAKRVLAVGTTTVRVLETLARGGPLAGRTDLFVTPGFEFQRVDALLTNFHLPRSTLLLLVAAFAGQEHMFRAYAEAVAQRYRFLSFGDAMLIV